MALTWQFDPDNGRFLEERMAFQLHSWLSCGDGNIYPIWEMLFHLIIKSLRSIMGEISLCIEISRQDIGPTSIDMHDSGCKDLLPTAFQTVSRKNLPSRLVSS